MVTKIKQCYNILKYIPDPTTMKVIEISETVKCSERLVWMALKRLRDERAKASDSFRTIEELTSFLLYYQWFMRTNMVLLDDMRPVWSRKIKQIERKVLKLQEIFPLNDKGERRG